MMRTFLAGCAIGIIGTVSAPRVLDSYLSEAIRGTTELVEGTVVAKERCSERLLLSALTPRGA
jgi:small basic protein